MIHRLSFWLGLLMGGLASFGTRRIWMLTPPTAPLLDLVSDAAVVCNAQGHITLTNAAARRLFGPDGGGSRSLCYPSGQPVPPGQTPLALAGRGEAAVEGRYVLPTPTGERLLDVRAWPHDGGATSIFRDVTVLNEMGGRAGRAQETAWTLNEMAQRLVAADGAALPQAVSDAALTLLEGLPDARASVYGYNIGARTLTLLASAPDDRPKRPKSQWQAQPPTLPFDANDPQLWSVYVAREPYQPQGGKSLTLPLLSEGAAIGHLSLTCGRAGAFEEAGRRDALTTLASCAASALAHRQQAARTSELAAQMETLRDVGRALAEGRDRDALADIIFARVPAALGVELCLIAWTHGGKLRPAGAAYRDALLFPERPLLPDEAMQEAAATGRAVQRVGLANPDFQTGPWRAFAGQSGRHSILSLPVALGRGALTVYVAGDAPFSDAQVRFMETLAALLGASPPAGRKGS